MSTKKKIAIFHNLPPGGAKRYIYEICKELKKKYEIHEYKLSTSSSYLELRKLGIVSKTYKYQTGHNLFQFTLNAIFKLSTLQKKIAGEIDDGGYECVIVNHDFITKSPHLLRHTKTCTIYICHEPQREFYENQNLHSPLIKDKISNLVRYPIKIIDKVNTSRAKILISNSQYSKKVLFNVYKRNSLILYPGVDSYFFKPLRLKKRYVISIGGLLPIKGHQFTIKSLSLIHKEQRPDFIIVGGGRKRDEQSIINLGKKLDVNIKLINKISDSELVDLYNKSYCLLNSAYGEPFGLSIVEAMSCGIPVVVIKNGGIGEQIINNKTGYCISERDQNKFAKKIKLAIKKHAVMGSEARKHVLSRWQWRSTLRNLEVIIKECQKQKLH